MPVTRLSRSRLFSPGVVHTPPRVMTMQTWTIRMRRVSDLWTACALVVTLAACTRAGRSDEPIALGSHDVAPLTPSTPSTASAATSVPPSPSMRSPATCAGLEKTACALRPGCVVDQPHAGAYVCRPAKNACEAAVRHADILGTEVPGVTASDASTAAATCAKTPGCQVAGGKCACICAVFGSCDCSCGGGFLPRCVPSSEASSLEGYPKPR